MLRGQSETVVVFLTFQGSPSFALAQKIKALKADLKLWNEQVFGNVAN